MSQALRQAHRTTTQRYFSDPLVGGIVWFVLFLFRILPVKAASSVGACLGQLLYYCSPKRNRVGRFNLMFAFPEKTDDERELILKKMWQHWGRTYAELPHGESLFKQADISGLSYLKEMAKQKKGCFVCSGHIGNFELAVTTNLFDDYCLNPVYRSANNPWLDKVLFQRRVGTLIPKGSQGAKKMIELLRNGKGVVMLCDQKLREGIDVLFFNKPAKTAPAIATVALKLNIPIFMARCIRLKNGQFKIDVYPLPISQNKDKNQAIYETMLSINQELEKWIRETPEQWLWIHRRFDKSEYN
ncbi:MAG: hypothetical protein IJY58_01065 [Alphaproteobacteria bacterium]|nr:hypothetical protein [Alphaproteobacteria bacterium]